MNITRIYLVSLMMLVIAGCSTPKHFYSGPELSINERVTIWTPAAFLDIKKINDIGIVSDVLNLGDRVYAKAGKNTITVEVGGGDSSSWSSSGYSVTNTGVLRGKFSAELIAGHTYFLDSKGGRLTLRDLGTTFTLPEDSLLGSDEYYKVVDEARTIGSPIRLYK